MNRPSSIPSRPTTIQAKQPDKAFNQAMQDAYVEIHNTTTGRVVVYQTDDGAYHTIEWELWKRKRPGRFVAGVRRITAGLTIGRENIFSESS